jgi:chromosome segregation protein
MYLKSIELSGFKSFAKKSELQFNTPIASIVGPNGSGKSNIAEAFRFVLGEQSFKSMRGKRGEDLIWGGSEQTPRANRASVRVTFDNTARLFDVDFDEIVLERVVHRDGINQYSINGSTVRLKDIAELLASANIGSSGHHIISQGEADRILSANSKERREVIEDALGLKVFQYKKKESERKLQHTHENISHVISLRKEIAPHLRFLKRQVEKIEKSKQLRDQLKDLLKEYLKRESLYLAYKKEEIKKKRAEPQARLGTLEQALSSARATLEKSAGNDEKSKEILSVEKELSVVRTKKDELSRTIGRLEGQIAFAEKHQVKTPEAVVALADIKGLEGEVTEELTKIERADSLELVKAGIGRVRTIFSTFFSNHSQAKSEENTETELEEMKTKKALVENDLKEVSTKEATLAEEYKRLQDDIEATKDESRDAEREVFRITAEKNEVESTLRDCARDEEALTHLEAEFKRDMEEGAVLVGREILVYDSMSISRDTAVSEKRDIQEDRKREVERIKIRLEESGGGSGEEVMKEYQEATERDSFLEREITDLEHSAETLEGLIKEMDEKLAVRFKDGMQKINKEFQHFFSILFGGGTASLTVTKAVPRRSLDTLALLQTEDGNDIPDEEEVETGIDISVSLPRKKIKGLQMLSGGERALTSIALLFAMSQVNPPPFLILDETEAALDEANSRKYASMIKDLSKKTQLILITHNRETMSVAGVLYGVTMGADGVSKLLSVQFEEAVKVAK